MSPRVRGTTTSCSPPSLPSRHSAPWGKAAASSEQQTLRACTARRDHARYADRRDAGGVPRRGHRRHGREVDMTKGRLEAFTDGVIAVIITIMVLEMKVPHGADPSALAPLVPVFLSYLLSFIFTGIYWNNHHHMFHAVHHVNGATLWANLHLLFWLSLVPFVTGWMDENHFARVTVAAYC